MAGKYKKDEILAKGMKLIREQGYNKTGINDILKVCGIPKGSFYNFFKTKDDFGFQAIDLYNRYVKSMYERFDRDFNLGPREKLEGFFQMSNDNFKREKCTQNCLLLSLSNEISESNSIFAERVLESFEEFKYYLDKWIVEGQEKKIIRSDRPAREMTNFLYDSYHGAVIRMKYQRNCTSLDGFLEQHLAYIFL